MKHPRKSQETPDLQRTAAPPEPGTEGPGASGGEEAAPKKRRGRPPKSAAAAQQAPAEKKPRGRPRKNPAEKAPRKRATPTGKTAKARRPTEAEVVDAELVEAEPEEGEITPEIFGLDTEEAEAEVVEVEKRPAAVVPLPVETEVDEEEEEAETSIALSRTDPLARYMQEVSRHPVLSREEEHTLAVRYAQTGDLDAAYRLVASNLRLVVKIAYEYRRAAFNVLDLIQEGNVGLMNAVKKYDPYKGVKLSTYAAWWIRAYILRFVMDNWRMVKLGTTQAQRKLFFNLRKEQQKLAAEGFDAGPKLLAERLNVTEREVEEMDRRLGGDELSIDMPVSSDEGAASYGDRLSLPARAADDELGDAELKAMLREELEAFGKTLEGKDRFIFEKRMISDEPLTLQEIGDQFGISRERARQIEAKLVGKLRERMQERMPDFADLTPTDDD